MFDNDKWLLVNFIEELNEMYVHLSYNYKIVSLNTPINIKINNNCEIIKYNPNYRRYY